MSRMPIRYALENPIEQAVVNKARDELGILGLKLGHKSDQGWPDRGFFIPGGKLLLIEFKRPGEEPRPNQEEKHEILRGLGYEVQVHDDVGTAFQAIRSAVAAARRAAKGNEVLP